MQASWKSFRVDIHVTDNGEHMKIYIFPYAWRRNAASDNSLRKRSFEKLTLEKCARSEKIKPKRKQFNKRHQTFIESGRENICISSMNYLSCSSGEDLSAQSRFVGLGINRLGVLKSVTTSNGFVAHIMHSARASHSKQR